jgi:hypothetical protein
MKMGTNSWRWISLKVEEFFDIAAWIFTTRLLQSARLSISRQVFYFYYNVSPGKLESLGVQEVDQYITSGCALHSYDFRASLAASAKPDSGSTAGNL